MSRKVYIPLIIIGILLTAILSYQITSLILLTDNKHQQEEYINAETYEDEDEIDVNLETNAVIQTEAVRLSRITPSTRIVYQYYYTLDDKLVTDECEPPYYLIDMTRQQLEGYYTDWQLISFSTDKVVLRKSINERVTEGYYIIKAYNGKIAVFYDYTEAFELAFEEAIAAGKYTENERNSFFNEFININKDHYLREVLDTPINTLSTDEQNALTNGIQVYGDDELIRILENYSS